MQANVGFPGWAEGPQVNACIGGHREPCVESPVLVYILPAWGLSFPTRWPCKYIFPLDGCANIVFTSSFPLILSSLLGIVESRCIQHIAVAIEVGYFMSILPRKSGKNGR